MRPCQLAPLVLLLCATAAARADARSPERFPLFAYLTGSPAPTMVAYTPSQLDPRQEANQRALPTSSIRADLAALRPAFDGLVLYASHEGTTHRILAVARDLKFRAVLLGVWDPRSADELDEAAELARLHHDDFAIGIVVGNEGIAFNRYEKDDLTHAAQRLRKTIPKDVPLTTSDTRHATAEHFEFFKAFGDFLAPNIHPYFDAPDLGPAEAAAWARKEAAEFARRCGKPVLLKETGLPHAGKSAVSPEAQRDFWHAYLTGGSLARVDASGDSAWVFHGVAFEAFDLPWKAEASGLPVEKSWGLLSDKREPYPALSIWRVAREAADKAKGGASPRAK